MSISTHVLDAVTGTPAQGLSVTLERRYRDYGPVWTAVTDVDGRIADLLPNGTGQPGVYRLRFDVESYFDGATFYPEVVIVFRVTDAAAHHHVPLLLSPFAYSTYRGS